MAHPSTGKISQLMKYYAGLSLADKDKMRMAEQMGIDQLNRQLTICKSIAFQLNGTLHATTAKVAEIQRTTTYNLPAKDPVQAYEQTPARPGGKGNAQELTEQMNKLNADMSDVEAKIRDNNNKMQNLVYQIKLKTDFLSEIDSRYPPNREEAISEMGLTLQDMNKKETIILILSILYRIQASLPSTSSNNKFLDRQVALCLNTLSEVPDIYDKVGRNVDLYNQQDVENAVVVMTDIADNTAIVVDPKQFDKILTKDSRALIDKINQLKADPTVSASLKHTEPNGDPELNFYGDNAKDPNKSAESVLADPMMFLNGYVSLSEEDAKNALMTQITDSVTFQKVWQLYQLMRLYPGLVICSK